MHATDGKYHADSFKKSQRLDMAAHSVFNQNIYDEEASESSSQGGYVISKHQRHQTNLNRKGRKPARTPNAMDANSDLL